MQTGSPLVTQLAVSLQTGNSLVIPEVLSPVISYGLPYLAVAPSTGAGIDVAEGSATSVGVINQGASTASQSFKNFILHKGVYRISGQLISTNFVGPAASSASPLCARVIMYITGSGLFPLAFTFLNPSVPQYSGFFSYTINMPYDGSEVWTETFVATGVGQTIGVYSNLYAERLV